MIPIDSKKPDWNRIRADYVSGGSSLRKLAKEYGISNSTIEKRAAREAWARKRKAAQGKVVENVVRKTAEKAADNATLAADIRRKGLEILNNLFDDFRTVNATEHRDYQGMKITDIKRLRDLTAAYKDLTGDIVTGETQGSELLQSLFDLERRSGV